MYTYRYKPHDAERLATSKLFNALQLVMGDSTNADALRGSARAMFGSLATACLWYLFTVFIYCVRTCLHVFTTCVCDFCVICVCVCVLCVLRVCVVCCVFVRVCVCVAFLYFQDLGYDRDRML